MNIPNFFSLIQTELDMVERGISQRLRASSKIIEQMIHYTLEGRGKRLRPALVLLAGKAVGRLEEAHIRTAIAIELIHTATLVHDDIIDEATLRRQKTSLNVKYGNEMAVIFGDYLLAAAFSMLVEMGNQHVLGKISEVTNTICEGELFQTHRRFDFNVSQTDYMKMIEQKTASLFAVSCHLGAALAGAGPGEQDRLGRFGQDIGTAFQIMDDCLDILGDEQRIGKSLGTDVKKGKWTLPLILLRKVMRASDWEDVRMLLFDDLEEMRMRRLQEYLTEHAALDCTFKEAQAYVQKAKSHLEGMPPTPALEALRQLADDIVERHRTIFQKTAPLKAVGNTA